MTDDNGLTPAERKWQNFEEEATSALSILMDDADGWTIHAVTLAGRSDSDDLLHLAAVRSKVGDTGLLLSLRYYTVDVEAKTGSWSGASGVEMRVNGPLPQALIKAFARATNDGLAGDQDEVPLALDATGSDVVEDPAALRGPIGDDRRDDVHDPEPAEPETVTCDDCGADRDPDEVVTLDLGGVEFTRCRGECVAE